MANKLLIYDSKPYEFELFRGAVNESYAGLSLEFQEAKLDARTAALARGCRAVCLFVHDSADAAAIERLAEYGVELIALRCAGFNNVDLTKAAECGIRVVRVPEYSPYAVAEHTMALLLTVNRKTHRAYSRVRDNNFSLNGLIGFDLHGKTVGVIGTGKIGKRFIQIAQGFGCRVIAYDLYPDHQFAQERGIEYHDLPSLYGQSDVISLHAPLTPETHHLVNADSLAQMKPGVVLLNTSRGPLIDTQPLIDALKSGQVRAAGLDVYEEEDQYFFEDFSNQVLQDDQLARLLSFNNVVITAHQAFLTEEALSNIINTTLTNVQAFYQGSELQHLVSATN